MLLEIHNLPFNINYNEIKEFLLNKFGLNGFILDNLEQESPRSKKITVGLADESDAAILTRKVHGTFLCGQQLYIENAKQLIAAEQPQNSSVLHNVHNFLAPMSHASNRNPMSMSYQMSDNIPFMQAQTIAPALVQPHRSDDTTYQNNIPFYQQQFFESPEVSAFRVNTRKFDTQGRRGDNHNNLDRDDEQRHDNTYCDRNAYRDRSKTLNRDPHRDSDVNRDRDGNGDGHRSSFSHHDSVHSRNNGKPENINRHKSEWKTEFHNQRDLKANKKKALKYSASNSQPRISPWIQQPYRPSTESSFLNKPSYVVSDNYDLPNQMSIQDCWNTQSESQSDNLKRNYELHVSFQERDIEKRLFCNAEKFNAPPSAQVPPKKKIKPNNALPPKKPKIYSIALPKKIIRHNTWVQQVTSFIAKQVLQSAGVLENQAVLLELKKCIQNRINMIFGNKLADTIHEVKHEYETHYNADKNYELYKAIQEKVNDKTKYGEQSDNKDIETKPPPQPSQSTSANVLAQNIASTSQSCALPVPQIQKKSPENLDVQPNLPKIAAAKVKRAKIKLLNLPIKDGKGGLNEPYKSVLTEHVKDIQTLADECCREVDRSLGVNYDNTWKRSVINLGKVLEMHTTNRLLKVKNNLTVRIYCADRPPRRYILEAFLKRYNVISLRKSTNLKIFDAYCGDYQGFDNLCKRKQAIIDNKLVFFKPVHLIGAKERCPKKGAAVIEHSEDDDSDNLETFEKDIAECKQDILNDIIMLEDENEIIDLDEHDENIENETYDQKLHDVETIALISNNDENTSNPLQHANIDNAQSDFKETEISDKSDADNVPKETINDNQNNDADTLLEHVDVKHYSPNLIVGDKSYVVLDDVDDDDGANHYDINEDDLEDF